MEYTKTINIQHKLDKKCLKMPKILRGSKRKAKLGFDEKK
jgi:hypothetical protein